MQASFWFHLWIGLRRNETGLGRSSGDYWAFLYCLIMRHIVAVSSRWEYSRPVSELFGDCDWKITNMATFWTYSWRRFIVRFSWADSSISWFNCYYTPISWAFWDFYFLKVSTRSRLTSAKHQTARMECLWDRHSTCCERRRCTLFGVSGDFCFCRIIIIYSRPKMNGITAETRNSYQWQQLIASGRRSESARAWCWTHPGSSCSWSGCEVGSACCNFTRSRLPVHFKCAPFYNGRLIITIGVLSCARDCSFVIVLDFSRCSRLWPGLTCIPAKLALAGSERH